MIAFRLDANAQVASGHLFRCIAIAKECIRLGQECIFFLAQGSFTEPLEQDNIPFELLDLYWDDWNFGIDKLKDRLITNKVKYLVVDSYRVTAKFFEQISETVPVLYMDDFCQERYQVAAALHYSEWPGDDMLARLYDGTKTKIYAGLDYIPLRKEYSFPLSDAERKYDILITTGGSDTYHITKEVLRKLVENDAFARCKIVAVLGGLNEDVDELRTCYEKQKNITILHNIKNMHEIMRNSKLAVTAGGTTVYELMASKTQFVCFSFSEDQESFGIRIEAYGICTYAGDARRNVSAVVKRIEQELEKMYYADYNCRLQFVDSNKSLVDGKGSERIAKLLIDLCRSNYSE